MPLLLTLPQELIERILLLLDAEDITNCKLISREFNVFIRSSILLKYLLACHAAGVIDNPRCESSYAERYQALLKREKAWSRLEPVFTKTFNLSYEPSSIYDLTAGVFLLGDTNYRDLHYCTLPSTSSDIPQWTTIHAHGPNKNWEGALVDMGMAIYEHDLIVNVVSSPINIHATRIEYSLDMILLKFSTGEYHPLARLPRIHVQDSYAGRPAIALEIVGDTIALAVGSARGMSRDRLFIFDWKTGCKRLQHEATANAYSSLVFLSPGILLVPNVVLGLYEVWKIPPDKHSVPSQILCLRFPTLSRGHFILNLVCRGEPNPYPHTIPHAPPRPFHPSPDHAIIITIIRLASFPGLLSAAYTLIFHRQSLITTIASLTSSTSLDIEHCHLNQATTTRSPDTNISSSLSSAITIDPQDPSSTPSRGLYTIPSVAWSEWGPPISRWFDQTQTRWITVSAGQRWVVLDPVLDGTRSWIKMIDFNPYHVHRMQVAQEREEEGSEDVVVQPKGGQLARGHAFAEDIEMGLGCTIYTAPGVYELDGLLMEEEKLLGLKINDAGNIEKVTVFHIG